MKKLFLILSMVLSLTAFGHDEDHPMATITGKNINLSIQNHTFAGRVNDKIIFARVTGPGHIYNETIIDNGTKVINTVFEKTKEYFGGVILDKGHSSSLEFMRAVDYGNRKVIEVRTGTNKIYEVEITADAFDGSHFTNPEYKVTVDGEEISFKLNGGKACLMMSAQLIFSILGTYIH